MKEKIIKFLKKYWLAFVIIISTFAIDMITKQIITNTIKNRTIIVIKDFFNLSYTLNTGAGWSVLSGKTSILIIISIVALGFFVYLMKDFDMKNHTFYSLGLSLMLGGLFGNFVERIFNGAVTDFLDFTIFGYDYPVFNCADIFLVAGAISLIISLLFTKEDVFEFKKKNALENQKVEEEVKEEDK